MRKILLIIIMISNVNFVYSQNHNSTNQVLQKVYEKLKTVKSISFDQVRELNYSSENYNNISNWNCYYKSDSNENLIGIQFQVQSPTYSEFFNGTEFFSLNKQDKTYTFENEPKIEELSGKSYFYNSILTLSNILPLIINDKTAEKTVIDTLINGKQFKNIKINIGKRRIQNLGKGFSQVQTKSNFIYKILIDVKNYLPKEILQVNDLNSDFIKVSFDNYNLNPPNPKENTWFYSTYKNEYRPLEKTKLQLLGLGESAPDWKLNFLNKNEIVSLEKLKGKVVLLDFWIKNCGACIESIGYLNDIYEKYKDKNFELLGINSYDTTENINFFSKKYGIKYPVLVNGNSILEKYGVNRFPTIFILDKNGKIIYSDIVNPDRNQIDSIIRSALE